MISPRLFVAAATVAIGVVGSGVVAEDRKAAQQQLRAGQPQAQAPGEFQAQPIRGSRLIGLEVFNKRGEDLGHIQEIILDESQDRVQYIVLAFGGWAGTGVNDKLFAVPFQSITFSPDARKAMLMVPRERLKNAPGFDQNRYPEVAKPDFANNVQKFYREHREEDDQGGEKRDVTRDVVEHGEHWSQDRQAFNLRALSQVIGSDVEDAKEYNIADIEDVVIDGRGGKLAYAILSYGGALRANDKQALVPWSALRPQPKDGQYTLNTTEESLDAVAFTNKDWGKLSDQAFANTVHERFDSDPYWHVHGTATEDEPATGWSAEDEMFSKFDAGQEKQVTGEIASLGRYYPKSGSAPGLRIRVENAEGQSFIVLAGPVAYARQQRIRLYPGQQVQVSGSEAEVGGRKVIVASQIKQGEQTLQLRDEQGKPKWTSEALKGEYTRPYIEYHNENKRD